MDRRLTAAIAGAAGAAIVGGMIYYKNKTSARVIRIRLP